MLLARPFLLSTALSLILLAATQNSGAQPPPADYYGVIQAVRDAKKKAAADERGIYPLIAIIQGEAYAKALREAAEHNDDAALLELYQAKYNKQWPRTVEGTPLLAYAAMNGDAEVVQRLLARGADVNAANEEEWTALHHAAEDGNARIVKMLLAKGADANARTDRFGETPLMLACGLYGGGRGGADAARLLLGRGAKINTQTKDGETALMFAAHRGLADVVKLLLAKKADPTLKDFKGGTALSRVEEFERVDADGKITYTQDSPTVPTYRLKVFEALIQHGKARPGFYVSEEAEREGGKPPWTTSC